MCIMSAYALLKVVGYYDLSVLSMSVMGFQNKTKIGWSMGGWDEFCPILLDFWNFFNCERQSKTVDSGYATCIAITVNSINLKNSDR